MQNLGKNLGSIFEKNIFWWAGGTQGWWGEQFTFSQGGRGVGAKKGGSAAFGVNCLVIY